MGLTKNNNKKSNNNDSKRVRFRADAVFSKIPDHNIIDLRKLEEERKQRELERAAKNHKNRFISFLKNIRLPRFRREKKTETKPKLSEPEEKIITTSLIEGRGVDQSQKVYSKQTKSNFIIFSPPHGWPKKMIGFAVVCLILVLPVYFALGYQRAQEAKGKILGISSEAYSYLQSAGVLTSESQYKQAQQEFGQATETFVLAEQELKRLGGTLVDIVKVISSKAKSAHSLLEAGQALSQAGEYLTQIVASLNELELDPLDNTKKTVSLTDSLWIIKDNIIPVQGYLQTAHEQLMTVEAEDLPAEYQESIRQVKKLLPQLNENFDYFVSLSDVFLTFLGHDSPKRYLLVFQNNREMRPTGGFIGSVALIDIYQGKIEKLEVPGGGSYDIAGQVAGRVVAPKPLWLVNPYWNIQDANWFVDFPTSAQKIMWFYERGGGATVDGVIALTPTVIEGLLRVLGPIDMQEKYGLIVTDRNFVVAAQSWAEINYDKEENKPKQFIADLLPEVLNLAFDSTETDAFSLIDVFAKSLQEKQLLLYFSDEETEKVIKKISWAGAIKETEKDYLQVVNTNIGGGKTDLAINQIVELVAEIQLDGSVIDTVTVTRIHHGAIRDQWEGVTNVDYMRFYVPAGSQLLESSGFEQIPLYRYHQPDPAVPTDKYLDSIEQSSIVDERSGTRMTSESGKTVFGNWISVEPGEAKKVQIRYKLPFKLEVGGLLSKTDTYSLLVQKQPGMLNNFFIGKVVLAPSYEVHWQYPQLKRDGNAYSYTTEVNTDKYFGVVLKK